MAGLLLSIVGPLGCCCSWCKGLVSASDSRLCPMLLLLDAAAAEADEVPLALGEDGLERLSP